jgi:hypothetical protein
MSTSGDEGYVTEEASPMDHDSNGNMEVRGWRRSLLDSLKSSPSPQVVMHDDVMPSDTDIHLLDFFQRACGHLI